MFYKGGGYATWNGENDEQVRGSCRKQGVTLSYIWAFFLLRAV